MLNSLSGRFLILTTVFVMLAEIFIFVPSVARFREDYLLDRLERAQIASLALLADDMIDRDLEEELLLNAGVFNVVLRRDEARQLVLSSPMPGVISETYDLRDSTAGELIARLEGGIRRLEAEGIPRATILRQGIITPSCGLGSLTPEHAEAILKLTLAISEHLRAQLP